ncbi:class I SAM-dependent methyltransferase [Streptacidiphilus sp. PB12-B1b]|uniref:class I SAM-dependent methyltransferase n=1 Tax=Streptacidiphilus sp. PB12-B1b TaxID=2705012 RepID=UPI0015FB8D35|nr:class I SAM-dependent methyltransferase [Streptacidiphilus sp. PB12-B1b]QMU75198.1 class I SAM-dependent methyltransferase [Streptacidiphilus sp. PB12-B1b]
MTSAPHNTAASTEGRSYTDRLVALERVGFKRLLPTQAPYRWNLRRLRLGRVLDVGCGLGRNLANCDPGSVGVDHNATSVATARSRGLNAFTSDEFPDSPEARPGSFDSLLCAHVLEHMDPQLGRDVLTSYLPYVRPGGSVVLITPQEAGYASDATHVHFIDFDGLREVAADAGIEVRRSYSFPFPRSAGKLFRYNEFVLVGALTEQP